MKNLIWRTSVKEIVTTFRDALQGLIPFLRQARIPIGVHPGVDAWDDISEALFRHIVIESLRWSMPVEETDDFSFPEYEVDYESYDEFGAVLEVAVGEDRDDRRRHLVFHSFKTTPSANGLTTVLACRVGKNWVRLKEPLVELAFESCDFRCLLKSDGVKRLTVLEISL